MSSYRDPHLKRVGVIRLFYLPAIFVGCLFLLGCSSGNNDPAEGGNLPSNLITPKGWELVWSDEFDGTSLDSSKWNIQTGDGSAEGIPGWGNQELQDYQVSNVSVNGGSLIITARNEMVDGDAEYTSGRINTAGKFDFRYGRVEANIHAPKGQGLWSAFWMLPTDSAYGTWAAGGEIDIMEIFSHDPMSFTQAALHYGMAWPLNTYTYKRYEGIDPTDGFHVHALEWDADEIRWFVDGVHFHTVSKFTYWNYYRNLETNAHESGSESAPFDRAFHLLLNLAIGGTLPGAPVASSFPAELRVDYVRVYKCNIDETTGIGCAGFIDYTSSSVASPFSESVFTASYDLYTNAVGPLAFPNSEDLIPLNIGVYDAGGAFALTEINGGDERGMVLEIETTGGGNFNVYPADQNRLALFGMGSASDPANYAGELMFDLYVSSTGTDLDSTIQIKMDSGFPDLGYVELQIADLPLDEWTTLTVQISDIAHKAGQFGGGPVDLGQILSLFVLEPLGTARLRVDNIRLICGHVEQNGCGIIPPTSLPPTGEPQPVYIDTVDPVWDAGIAAADSGTGWSNYYDGTTENKVQWRELEADDAARGKILEVRFSDSAEFGVWFIGASLGVDLSSYAAGSVSFDVKVDDYGANEDGLTIKIDCVFPCTSGDQAIGKVGDGMWETVVVPVAQLLGGGLSLATVNTGVVIFPTDQSSVQTFQLDNVQWLPGESNPSPSAGVVTLYDDAIAEGWSLWDCCGGAEFNEVEDNEEHGKVVELAFGAVGTVTGFQAAASVDVSHLGAGTLAFDFKEVVPPPEGSVWLLKLESDNAATSVELELAVGDNPEPGDSWQQYRYSLDGDLAGLDLRALKLVMIFPTWANADGAIGRIDNVRFEPEAVTIELYGDAPAEGWYLWDCCGAATFAEVAEEERGSVIELTFGAGGTVTGLQAATGIDASAVQGGTLVFDFKEVEPPPAGSQWHVKLESSNASTAVDILMTRGGNPQPSAEWQTYSYDLNLEFAALDLSDLKLVLFFPDWENAEGAVARIDNVQLVGP